MSDNEGTEKVVNRTFVNGGGKDRRRAGKRLTDKTEVEKNTMKTEQRGKERMRAGKRLTDKTEKKNRVKTEQWKERTKRK
ncbi:hypothetical protein L210DRAFT_74140 [Boletus edulis BED1]|uniref:Uncharacterized protein n=1 Tax=Boletus edulis BED1 TaxID=1328754 RepID=A0AAD4BZI2_BOLED|nr:hypothetical protein L210DRAFT_74140 [Boletus edulis BED1]